MAKQKKIFIIFKNDELEGCFSTLKTLCEEMQKINDEFPSYWTLARETSAINEKTGFQYAEYRLFAALLVTGENEVKGQGNPALSKEKPPQ